MQKRIKNHAYLAMLLGSSFLATQVFAQEASSTATERSEFAEIIVTAQKRSEVARLVPLTITALDGVALKENNISNIYDLGKVVPGLSFAQGGAKTYPFMRGIGSSAEYIGAENGVALHINGAYIASQFAAATAYFDIARVEAVAGPQGDLYGRNATGGSINVITARPNDYLEGAARVTLGNYNLRSFEASISGPIAGPALKARLAAFSNARNGFGKNITTGNDIDNQDDYGARLTLSFDPGSGVKLDVIGDYYKADGTGPGWHYLGPARPGAVLPAIALGGVPADTIRNVSSDYDTQYSNEVWGVTALGEVELGAATLKSITAYRAWDSGQTGMDFDFTSFNLTRPAANGEYGNQFSQELQVSIQSDRYDVVAGLYYFNEHVGGEIFVDIDGPLQLIGAPPGAAFRQTGTADTDAYAAFVNASFSISDKLKIIGGARYSSEKRSSDAQLTSGFGTIPTGGNKTFNAFTPKLTVQYFPTPDWNLYASVGRGFKSGFFNVGQPGPALDPEEVTAYEVGAKGKLADGRLLLSLSAFYYDYSNLVVTKSVGTALFTENAASATIKGVEASITAKPAPGLSILAAASYLQAQYAKFGTEDPTYPERGMLDLRGNFLNNAPEWTLHFAPTYKVDVGGDSSLSFGANITYQSRQFFDAYNDPNAERAPNTNVDGRITFDSGKNWSFAIWGKNLLNNTIIQSSAKSVVFLGYPRLGWLAPPRTFGADFSIKF